MKGLSAKAEGGVKGPTKTFDFDLSSIRIAPAVSPSANIITVSS